MFKTYFTDLNIKKIYIFLWHSSTGKLLFKIYFGIIWIFILDVFWTGMIFREQNKVVFILWMQISFLTMTFPFSYIRIGFSEVNCTLLIIPLLPLLPKTWADGCKPHHIEEDYGEEEEAAGDAIHDQGSGAVRQDVVRHVLVASSLNHVIINKSLCSE